MLVVLNKRLVKMVLNVSLLTSLFTSSFVSANDDFDPFSLMKSTPQGKQLLDISQNAEFDVELAQQQLEALTLSGVAELDIEYQVAEILAYIAVYYELSDFEKLNEKINELHLLGVKKGNDWILSRYFEQQAIMSLKQGRFLKGLEDSNKALEIAEPLNYQEVIASAQSYRAIFNSKLGHSSQSLQDFLSALTFYEQANNIKRLVSIYNNLVVLYIDRKDYPMALTASDKAIEMQNKMARKSVRIIAINYLNRAIIYSQLGDKDEELNAFVKAQEYAIASNDIGLLTSVYANLSDYFLRYENYTLAIERAEKCLETAAKTHDKYTQAICLLNKGLSLVKSGNISLGFEDLQQALTITEEEKIQATLVDVYDSFFEAYKTTEDHKSANHWLEKKYQILLNQARNDNENYFNEMEESFKQTIADRESVHSSLKSDMVKNILVQEDKVKNLTLALTCLTFFFIVLVIYIIRLRRRLTPKPYT